MNNECSVVKLSKESGKQVLVIGDLKLNDVKVEGFISGNIPVGTYEMEKYGGEIYKYVEFFLLVTKSISRQIFHKFNLDNRDIDYSKTKNYERWMRAHQWLVSPNSLIFGGRIGGDKKFFIISGQKRLMAIDNSESEQWMRFSFGWPEELYGYVDHLQKKSSKDLLKREKVINPPTASAICKTLFRYFKSEKTPTVENMSTDELMEFRNKIGNYVASDYDYVTQRKDDFDSIVKSPKLHFWISMYLFLGSKNKGQCNKFFDKLLENNKNDKMFYNLRDVLEEFGRRQQNVRIEAIIKCWNAFINGVQFDIKEVRDYKPEGKSNITKFIKVIRNRRGLIDLENYRRPSPLGKMLVPISKKGDEEFVSCFPKKAKREVDRI